MTNDNFYARSKGGRVQHILNGGTKTTLCGKDATLMNRYPALTRANSAVRTAVRTCTTCLHAHTNKTGEMI
jgi:hypothetical protein